MTKQDSTVISKISKSRKSRSREIHFSSVVLTHNLNYQSIEKSFSLLGCPWRSTGVFCWLDHPSLTFSRSSLRFVVFPTCQINYSRMLIVCS
jgi:hypothetical protein